MRYYFSAVFLVLSLLWTNAATAQSTSLRIVYGPCTITNITRDIDAQYAAAVGVMSTDKRVRERMLGSSRGRRDAALCTFQVSDAFCNGEFLEYSVNMLSNSMTAGGAGKHFFRALGAAEAVEDPAGNALGLTLGIGGAILGGIAGSNDGLGGVAKGGLTGGAIGLGAGKFWSTKTAYDRCTNLQDSFTDLTQKLVASGLSPQIHHRQLFGEIRRLSARYPISERDTAEAMIEAMAVAAAKIQSIR